MESRSLVAIVRERSVSAMGLEPFAWYKEMRTTDPVHFEQRDGVWEIFRYDHAQEILKNATLFSSERAAPADSVLNRGSILRLDPPLHNKLRGIISQAFTPRAINQMEARIRAIVNELLDARLKNGRLDIIPDLAYPLPVIVIAEMLGIPASERDMFKHWSDEIVSNSLSRAASGYMTLDRYFRGILDQRRKTPGDDLVSNLLSARLDDEPLTEDEVVTFCVLLLVAGNETTTNLIGNAVLCFDENPTSAQEIRANSTLLPGAIEEVLRFRSPVQRSTRITTASTMLGGKEIKAGQPVFVWLASANRDEEQFSLAETFDIKRNPNRHLGFGTGIHVCIGAPLARLETRVAFECLFERFQDIQMDRSVALQPVASFFGYGVEHLPVKIITR